MVRLDATAFREAPSKAAEHERQTAYDPKRQEFRRLMAGQKNI